MATLQEELDVFVDGPPRINADVCQRTRRWDQLGEYSIIIIINTRYMLGKEKKTLQQQHNIQRATNQILVQ